MSLENKDFFDSIKEVINKLKDSEITTFVWEGGSNCLFRVRVCNGVYIRTSDFRFIDQVISNRDQALANYYGVEISHLRKWIEAKEPEFPQCMAYTKKGKSRRCRHVAYNHIYRVPNHPAKWRSTASVYCPVHDGGGS